jgi:hypothetical protein
VRKLVAAVLFAFTGASLLVGSLYLSNLWDDYKDSPDSTYIEGAVIFLAVALMTAIAGAWALRSR